MRSTDLRSRILLAAGAFSCTGPACGNADSAPIDTSRADASKDGATTTHGAVPGSGGTGGNGSGGGAGGGATSGVRQTDASTDAAPQPTVTARTDAADAWSLPADDAATATVTDASTDAEAAGCAAYGQICSQTSDCCDAASGVTCIGGHCSMTIRRPFLVGSSLRAAAAVQRSDWQPAQEPLVPAVGLDAATARALAHDWLRDACEEHASIAAFARLTMHLLSVGAPPELVVASQRASVDEVRHARACFALAARYGKATLGPDALSLTDAVLPLSLPEIAALAAEEGCVGETLGALLAQEQLRRATDPVVRSVLDRAHIVTDEARHAELAWSFVAWAVAQGGAGVGQAVAAAIQRAVRDTLATPVRTYDGIDVDAWRAHGRLTCADARAVVEQGIREIIEPAVALVLGGRSPGGGGAFRDARIGLNQRA